LRIRFVYTRYYLSKIAPYVEIKNKRFHLFALTPAYAVGKIALLIQKNEHIYVKQTSDKYRNPDNKPDKCELKVISYFKEHPNAKNSLNYIKTIKIEDMSIFFMPIR